MEFWQSLILLVVILLMPKLRKAYFFYPTKRGLRAQPSQRLLFFDFAKGLAIMAVILIHSIYLFVEKFPEFDPTWLNVVNNLSRFAVGFFFIASGALLTSGLSIKKLTRVFVPYILVCIVVWLFQGKPLDLLIGGIIRGDLLPPYYFIPVLFQLYLLFPLLTKFKTRKYFLLVSIFISYLCYITPSLAYIAGVPTFGPFLFLFAFGMAYSDRLKSKKTFDNIDAWLLIIPVYIGLQFMLPGHYYNSRFFYAPALFVVLHFAWNKVRHLENAKFLQTLGRLSLWVYLVHFSIESFFVNLIKFDFGYSLPADAAHQALQAGVYLYIFLIAILTTVGSGVLAGLIATAINNNLRACIKSFL